MTKTKLVPFNWELYKAGAKAVFKDQDTWKILLIAPRDSGKWPFLLIYEINGMAETGSMTIDGIAGTTTILLEVEIEEKTFWVNVWPPGDEIHFNTLGKALENRLPGHEGTLKITYTEEDLIK